MLRTTTVTGRTPRTTTEHRAAAGGGGPPPPPAYHVHAPRGGRWTASTVVRRTDPVPLITTVSFVRREDPAPLITTVMVVRYIYIELVKDGSTIGDIVIVLHDDVPIASGRFYALCMGWCATEDGRGSLHYKAHARLRALQCVYVTTSH